MTEPSRITRQPPQPWLTSRPAWTSTSHRKSRPSTSPFWFSWTSTSKQSTSKKLSSSKATESPKQSTTPSQPPRIPKTAAPTWSKSESRRTRDR